MNLTIALAGNPNSGKTTLFNALTGSNQFVGNWPGVTVEKKEGTLKKHEGVRIVDLPGIYSLSPYTPEEVVARNYLIDERPDAILNIVDGTNLERNLYLTTQLMETGIPVVVAVNMMDAVKKNGITIHMETLSQRLGCPVVPISALKNTGIRDAASAAITAAQSKKLPRPITYSQPVELLLQSITESLPARIPAEKRRWHAIKVLEQDTPVIQSLQLPDDTWADIQKAIADLETNAGDDGASIITNERYDTIEAIIAEAQQAAEMEAYNTSDKIDRVVTSRILGLPIFAAVMFLVYWIAMVGVGQPATDWANDGLFGDGYHLFGIGSAAYEEKAESFGDALLAVQAFVPVDPEAEDFNAESALAEMNAFQATAPSASIEVIDEETLEPSTKTAYFDALPAGAGDDVVGMTYKEGAAYLAANGFEAPDPANDGIWVPGIPVLVESGLAAIGVSGWLTSLILDGIVAGVGAVLGFVPQMFVLFFLLAFLEACGYMARIAFVLDRIFRKFGLSGKSFIPMLIGTGCSVPAVMATRTIEAERDRRMTIITTPFIPCGAKVTFIALIAGAIFHGSALISTGSYFIGMAAIIVSGIMLKKTKRFAGDPAPFVMELPAYHWPTLGNLLRSMWERGWSFIRKAGTIILLSTIFIWFTSYFGFTEEGFRMLGEEELELSILARIGGAIAWIFAPLGWGNWQAAVASITGLVAKENIVGTMGILYGNSGQTVWAALAASFTTVTGLSFLVFNLLCAPCFAAIGAIKREMNSTKWTAFAIAYQCGFAYAVALIINQFGNFFFGQVNVPGFLVAVLLLAAMIYFLFRPAPKEDEILEAGWRSVRQL